MSGPSYFVPPELLKGKKPIKKPKINFEINTKEQKVLRRIPAPGETLETKPGEFDLGGGKTGTILKFIPPIAPILEPTPEPEPEIIEEEIKGPDIIVGDTDSTKPLNCQGFRKDGKPCRGRPVKNINGEWYCYRGAHNIK